MKRSQIQALTLFSLCLVGIAGLIVACDQQPQLSISSTYLLDDILANPADFPVLTRAQLLSSLSQGDLISMGESHELGLEREYLAQLYSDLAPLVRPRPVQCLVETGGMEGAGGPGYAALLDMDGPQDPVRAQFQKICARDKEFDNPQNDYTAELSKYLPRGRVLTHTGMRHIAPWGLLYPLDFLDPQWVDIPDHGTINREIPGSFVSQNRKIRAHGVEAWEDLLMPELTARLTASLRAGTAPTQAAQDADAQVSRLLASPLLQFGPQETAHVVEIHRFQLSYPDLTMYLSLLNHAAFDPSLLRKLLRSPQMAEFLKEVDPATLQSGVFIPNSPSEIQLLGSTPIKAAGTIYFTGNQAGSGEGGASSERLVFVLISPGQSPELGQ